MKESNRKHCAMASSISFLQQTAFNYSNELNGKIFRVKRNVQTQK